LVFDANSKVQSPKTKDQRPPPMIVDSHQHFWQVGRFDYPWMSSDLTVLYRDYLPPTLEPILAANGVGKTVLVQASNSVAESRWLLSLADQNPFIAGVVGWVNLLNGELASQLDELTSHPKFKGVRHLVESEPTDDWLAQPEVLRGLKELAAYNVSYDLLVHTRHLRHALIVAENCPDLRLVIDHMAKPSIAQREVREWSQQLKPLAGFQNVYCKLSGLVTEADWQNWKTDDLRPYVDYVLELFGPERMMFGSDYPVCLLASTYERVLHSFSDLLKDLKDEQRDRIFARNAIDFYQLN
jgi:L-fucono-1,5-lactonase